MRSLATYSIRKLSTSTSIINIWIDKLWCVLLLALSALFWAIKLIHFIRLLYTININGCIDQIVLLSSDLHLCDT